MRRHKLTRTLPYAPDQLFQLVGDIERYPEFVPWLTTMRTWNAHEIEPGVKDGEKMLRFVEEVRRADCTELHEETDGDACDACG